MYMDDKLIVSKNKQIDLCNWKELFNYNVGCDINFDEKIFNGKSINLTFIVVEKNDNSIKIISKITTSHGPILEIKFTQNENNQINAKLIFLRSYADYNANRLINIFLYTCHHYKVISISLEDDALFYNKDKSYGYRALLYRIFFNKQSIYILDTTGFTPIFTIDYTNEHYLNDIKILSESQFIQWEFFIKCAFDVSSYYRGFENKFNEQRTNFFSKLFNEYLNFLRENNEYEFLNCILGSMLRNDILKKAEHDVSDNYELYTKPKKIYDVSKKLYSDTYKCIACRYNIDN